MNKMNNKREECLNGCMYKEPGVDAERNIKREEEGGF